MEESKGGSEAGKAEAAVMKLSGGGTAQEINFIQMHISTETEKSIYKYRRSALNCYFGGIFLLYLYILSVIDFNVIFKTITLTNYCHIRHLTNK